MAEWILTPLYFMFSVLLATGCYNYNKIESRSAVIPAAITMLSAISFYIVLIYPPVSESDFSGEHRVTGALWIVSSYFTTTFVSITGIYLLVTLYMPFAFSVNKRHCNDMAIFVSAVLAGMLAAGIKTSILVYAYFSLYQTLLNRSPLQSECCLQLV